jgi:hypothetical protein
MGAPSDNKNFWSAKYRRAIISLKSSISLFSESMDKDALILSNLGKIS